MENEIEVIFDVRVKNAPLWDLAEKFGGIRFLAEYLGFHYSRVVAWINFKDIPTLTSTNSKVVMRYNELEAKIIPYGYTLDDIFPLSLRGKPIGPNKRRLQLRQTIQSERLLEHYQHELLELPSANLEKTEMTETIQSVIDTLRTETEKKVIRMRFGLGPSGREHTYEEIAKHFNVQEQRIRQIEAKALRELRHSSRSRQLKGFLGNDLFYQSNAYDKPANDLWKIELAECERKIEREKFA